MPEPLFHPNEDYTQAADLLDAEARELLRPLFNKYYALGYSVRDIRYIVDCTSMDITLDILISGRKN